MVLDRVQSATAAERKENVCEKERERERESAKLEEIDYHSDSRDSLGNSL